MPSCSSLQFRVVENSRSLAHAIARDTLTTLTPATGTCHIVGHLGLYPGRVSTPHPQARSAMQSPGLIRGCRCRTPVFLSRTGTPSREALGKQRPGSVPMYHGRMTRCRISLIGNSQTRSGKSDMGNFFHSPSPRPAQLVQHRRPPNLPLSTIAVLREKHRILRSQRVLLSLQYTSRVEGATSWLGGPCSPTEAHLHSGFLVHGAKAPRDLVPQHEAPAPSG